MFPMFTGISCIVDYNHSTQVTPALVNLVVNALWRIPIVQECAGSSRLLFTNVLSFFVKIVLSMTLSCHNGHSYIFKGLK
jgi:hypothetical protein